VNAILIIMLAFSWLFIFFSSSKNGRARVNGKKSSVYLILYTVGCGHTTTTNEKTII